MICAVSTTAYRTVARDGWVEIEVERSRFRGTVARVGDEQEARAAADRDAEDAKQALGERGPVWWTDGAPDLNRKMARNTAYADWFASVGG